MACITLKEKLGDMGKLKYYTHFEVSVEDYV